MRPYETLFGKKASLVVRRRSYSASEAVGQLCPIKMLSPSLLKYIAMSLDNAVERTRFSPEASPGPEYMKLNAMLPWNRLPL